MPKLKTFTAQIGDLPQAGGRRAQPLDFSPAVALDTSRISRIGQQIVNDKESAEKRDALVQTSALRAKYAKRLDDAAISGEELDDIKAEMADEFSKVGEDFVTSAGQDQLDIYTSTSSAMFDSQANTIAVKRAGLVAKQSATEFLNSTSETLRANPLYLPIAEQMATDFTGTLTGVSPEQKAVIKQGLINELNITAALGSARVAPAETKKALEDGEWNLTPKQRELAINAAETELRAIRADERYQREVKKAQRVERNEEAYDELVKGIFEGTASTREVLDNPDLLAPTRNTLLTLIEKRARELRTRAYTTTPSVYNDARRRIDLPQGDPNRLTSTEELWGLYGKPRGLSLSDTQNLEKRIVDNKTDAGMTYAKAESELISNLSPMLNKSTLLALDPGGGARVQAFTAFVRNRADSFREQGKDPYLLLQPGTSDYVGNFIPAFQSGAQEVQQDLANQLNELLRESARQKKEKEKREGRKKTPAAGGAPVEGTPVIDPIEETVIPTPTKRKPLSEIFK